MVGQIKAELKLIGPGEGASGLAGGGGGDPAQNEMLNVLKNIDRFFRLPSNRWGSSGAGALGNLLATPEGLATAAVAGVTAASMVVATKIGEELNKQFMGVSENSVRIADAAVLQIQNSSYLERLDLINRYGGSINGLANGGGGSQTPRFTEEGTLYSERDMIKDIVAEGEKFVATLNGGTVATNELSDAQANYLMSLYETLQAQQNITSELQKQASISINRGDLRAVGKGAETGETIYQGKVGDSTYTGKVDQGNLQNKFIGVRVKG